MLGPGSAACVTVDPVHNLVFVSGRSPGWGQPYTPRLAQLILDGREGRRNALDGDDSIGQILVFDRLASGNAKPLRILRGAKTMLSFPETLMTTYPPKGWLVAAQWGSEFGEHAESSPRSFVGVWSIYDNGNVAPHWTIGGPNGVLKEARGVALDPKHKEIFVSDKRINGVLAFEFPEMF